MALFLRINSLFLSQTLILIPRIFDLYAISVKTE